MKNGQIWAFTYLSDDTPTRFRPDPVTNKNKNYQKAALTHAEDAPNSANLDKNNRIWVLRSVKLS